MNQCSINLIGDIARVERGVHVLTGHLGLRLSEDGVTVQAVCRPGPIEVALANGQGSIAYETPVHFYRGLGLWVEAYRRQTSFRITETPQFATNGVMVDVSRNAVLTVDSIRQLLRHMALMGLNMLMLYTEDTFELPGYPYFGYMRGRYTADELNACDAYADDLGIEMVPCIQTLAHLKQALKWNYASDMRDTEDILLVGHDRTYAFIEDMMAATSSAFRSKRIHIGMDEAHRLGLGRYLEQHGYRKRFDLMNEHLRRVCDIAERHGLKPMIWSDMYFRLGSKTGNYYDLNAVIPPEAVAGIPDNVSLVYWDYYHDNPSFYAEFIRKHRQLGRDTIFAGGVWTWNGIAPNYGKTRATTDAALAACKREGVREVFATLWGDNGAETPIWSSLPGLQLFAEHGYGAEVSETRLRERFQACTGGQWDDFMLLDRFDTTPGVAERNPHESNPSKFLLWQDALIGLYDDNIRGLPMDRHYAELADRLDEAQARADSFTPMYKMYRQLAHVLSMKSELGIRLHDAYRQENRAQLATEMKQLEQLRADVDALRRHHRTLWLTSNNPFGWEVLDIRYGGLLARLETAEHRITEYLNGDITVIEELEAERLYFDAPWKMPQGTLGRAAYHSAATASPLSD